MSKIKNLYIKLRIAVDQWRKRRKLNFHDFTIISNNCWAATAVYQPFGLKYNTPTVGLFIMDEDYIKMLENLDYYLSAQLDFILPQESKYYNKISQNGNKEVNYPIAILGGDVEIHFLHYSNQKEALKKWQRRCKRINKNRLLIKMSLRDSGYSYHQMIQRFLSLPFPNKICFIPDEIKTSCQELIHVPELTRLNLVGGDETEISLRYIDIISLLNNLQ